MTNKPVISVYVTLDWKHNCGKACYSFDVNFHILSLTESYSWFFSFMLQHKSSFALFLFQFVSCRKRKWRFCGDLEKASGKGTPSHFIWSKNADVVVKEYRRKSGGKSEIMITVLTWFTGRFLWSRSSITGAISSFDSFYPNVFLLPVLHLPFTGPVCCGPSWC